MVGLHVPSETGIDPFGIHLGAGTARQKAATGQGYRHQDRQHDDPEPQAGGRRRSFRRIRTHASFPGGIDGAGAGRARLRSLRAEAVLLDEGLQARVINAVQLQLVPPQAEAITGASIPPG